MYGYASYCVPSSGWPHGQPSYAVPGSTNGSFYGTTTLGMPCSPASHGSSYAGSPAQVYASLTADDVQRINHRNYADRLGAENVKVPALNVEGDVIAPEDNPKPERTKSRSRSIGHLWRLAARESRLEKEIHHSQDVLQSLLASLRTLFSSNDTESVLASVIRQACNLLEAEACSVWFLEGEWLVSKVFTNIGLDDEGGETTEAVRIPNTTGVVGYVVKSKESVIINDAYSDSRFDKGVDLRTGFRTRSILACPLNSPQGELMGVAQLINKKGNKEFTVEDEDLLKFFATYCGMALHNSILMGQLKAEQSKNEVALELISHHAQVDKSLIQAVLARPLPEVDDEPFKGMTSYFWTPRTLSYDDSVLCVMRMFHELGLVKKFNLKTDLLGSFIMTVRKNYRDVPYHNWKHALSVTHTFFAIAMNNDLTPFLKDYEVLALLVACLCHDVDHRGKNNAYQKLKKSSLATVYEGSSVMERHHFSHTLFILRQPDNNIFGHFAEALYRRVLDVMKQVILATDLELHFGHMKRIKEMGLTKDTYDRGNSEHRMLLSGLLISCCDLNSAGKSFDLHKTITQDIFREFFEQGDEEKEAGEHPIPMMDREVAHIPQIEVGFFQYIAQPTFTLATSFLPNLQPMLDEVNTNLATWNDLQAEENKITNGEEHSHLPTL